MHRLLTPFRFVLILACMSTFVLHMCLVWMVLRDRWARVRLANRVLSYYSRFGVWLMNVKVRPVGLEHISHLPNALMVGNHLTYMDVLVISSVRSAGFVTSVEIKQTFGLGMVCTMAGCLFVERRNRGSLLNEVGELGEALKSGVNIAIFPEATSTNGEKILRFRRPLFMSAMQAQVPVVPFCLNYHTVGGEPINKVSRDWVFYYGAMNFVPHLWAMSGSGGIEVDLNFLKPISVAGVDDPTILAESSQNAVESVFKAVQ